MMCILLHEPETPNQPAAGDGGITCRFQIGHHWPAVPEPERFRQPAVGCAPSSSAIRSSRHMEGLLALGVFRILST
jgi:hypothetical protein